VLVRAWVWLRFGWLSRGDDGKKKGGGFLYTYNDMMYFLEEQCMQGFG
jgi:hypothetical protein